ncbi:hypothetical protein [Streptomyces cucumeris]|uniref:hypothetical protein n=1 Tax=Streptomyces cucumeris TaxID=2962890 RepID=UPI003D748DEA
MRDWLFILDPSEPNLDGKHPTKDRVLDLAKTASRREWWLARRRHMAAGDRIWIYFATPVMEVAAVADVQGEPWEVSGDAKYPWRVQAALNLEGTRALYRSPVPLAAMSNQHPQGVPLVRDSDLALLLSHAKV